MVPPIGGAVHAGFVFIQLDGFGAGLDVGTRPRGKTCGIGGHKRQCNKKDQRFHARHLIRPDDEQQAEADCRSRQPKPKRHEMSSTIPIISVCL
jgi:hypothetical protein